MKIALLGHGKMGHLIEQLARRKGIEVPVILEQEENENGRGITTDSMRGVDVCVDFSRAEAVLANVRACATVGKNLVIGTTGWSSELARVEAIVRESAIGVIYGANFSIGMNVFLRLADRAAELINGLHNYAPYIHEEHHARKLDAPSGTALELQKRLLSHYGDVPVSSTRAGHIPGTHTVGFDSEVDSITLTHTARSRQGFAEGALFAASWIQERKGLFRFRDVIAQEIGDSHD